MKALPEANHAGRTIWRVNYRVARRRIRKTFHSKEEADAWIACNRTIAVDEGRIFWEAWHGISNDERHELMDALALLGNWTLILPLLATWRIVISIVNSSCMLSFVGLVAFPPFGKCVPQLFRSQRATGASGSRAGGRRKVPRRPRLKLFPNGNKDGVVLAHAPIVPVRE